MLIVVEPLNMEVVNATGESWIRLNIRLGLLGLGDQRMCVQ